MSELRADTITASDGTSPVTLTKQSAAKAWGHFEGSDVVLDDSLNTSSVTDVGTGDFQINFGNAMDNEHYAAATASRDTGIISNRADGYTTTSYRFVIRNSNFTAVDRDDTTYVVHGDLA